MIEDAIHMYIVMKRIGWFQIESNTMCQFLFVIERDWGVMLNQGLLININKIYFIKDRKDPWLHPVDVSVSVALLMLIFN